MSDAGAEVEWDRLHLPTFAALLLATGVAEELVLHPLWVLKTVDQVTPHSAASPPAGLLRQQWQLAQALHRRTGWRTFFRGFWVSNCSALPCYVLYMLAYHWAKHQYAGQHLPSVIRDAAPFWAGLTAELATLPLYVPIDVLVQRMLLERHRGQPAVVVARHIWAEEGLRGVYRGSHITALQFSVGSAVFWAAYEGTKAAAQRVLRPLGEVGDMAVPVVAGMTAGLLSSLFTLPIDVVKTRIQCGGTAGSAVGGLPVAAAAAGAVAPYRTLWGSVRHMYATEGPRGFFRGLVPRLVARGPLGAVSSVVYEFCLRHSMAA
eukprot:EG_transcript_18112